MIIHKSNKSVETLRGFPNSNFGNYKNVFVLDDYSALGQKIIEHAPYFDFVIDKKGELIDITPTERPPQPPPEPDPLTLLQLAQAEMYEQYQLERQLDQLAMAEMFEMMMGGSM